MALDPPYSSPNLPSAGADAARAAARKGRLTMLVDVSSLYMLGSLVAGWMSAIVGTLRNSR